MERRKVLTFSQEVECTTKDEVMEALDEIVDKIKHVLDSNNVEIIYIKDGFISQNDKTFVCQKQFFITKDKANKLTWLEIQNLISGIHQPKWGFRLYLPKKGCSI